MDGGDRRGGDDGPGKPGADSAGAGADGGCAETAELARLERARMLRNGGGAQHEVFGDVNASVALLAVYLLWFLHQQFQPPCSC